DEYGLSRGAVFRVDASSGSCSDRGNPGHSRFRDPGGSVRLLHALGVILVLASSARASGSALGQAQINSVSISTGVGPSDSGSQRVVTSTDSSIITTPIELDESREGNFFLTTTNSITIAPITETPFFLFVNPSTNTV